MFQTPKEEKVLVDRKEEEEEEEEMRDWNFKHYETILK